MPPRRTLLTRLVAAAAGVAGLTFGSGAFTQTTADRDVALHFSVDDEAALSIEANTDLGSETVGLDDDGNFQISTDIAAAGAIQSVGRVDDLSASEPDIETEAFTITNNGTTEVALELTPREFDDAGTGAEIRLEFAEPGGDSLASIDLSDTGERASIDTLQESESVLGAVIIDSRDVDGLGELDAEIRISAIEADLVQ